eukprot:TRINITY_DN1604_c0_g1_i1.p1 TRINITY_DN1604_c0_g1~~TRINITY_DN1604_c0_g1_i1.p1  ORF type:complete len:870 (-),score=197.96 TRINITY_DN1604_c0_g1_i1:109-2718(-)
MEDGGGGTNPIIVTDSNSNTNPTMNIEQVGTPVITFTPAEDASSPASLSTISLPTGGGSMISLSNQGNTTPSKDRRSTFTRWLSNSGFNNLNNSNKPGTAPIIPPLPTMTTGGGSMISASSPSSPVSRGDNPVVTSARTPDPVDRVKKQRTHRRSASGILPNLMSLLNSPSTATQETIKKIEINAEKMTREERLIREVCSNNKQQDSCISLPPISNPGSLYESFLVIGLSPTSPSLAKPELTSHPPQVLYSYPPNSESKFPHAGDFCFPSGVTISFIKRTKSQSDLFKILFASANGEKHEDQFVFILTNLEKESIYGVCILKQETLTSRPSFFNAATSEEVEAEEKLKHSRFDRIAPRCYCLLTRYPFFGIHFDFLTNLIALEQVYFAERNSKKMTELVSSPPTSISEELNLQLLNESASNSNSSSNPPLPSSSPPPSINNSAEDSIPTPSTPSLNAPEEDQKPLESSSSSSSSSQDPNTSDPPSSPPPSSPPSSFTSESESPPKKKKKTRRPLNSPISTSSPSHSSPNLLDESFLNSSTPAPSLLVSKSNTNKVVRLLEKYYLVNVPKPGQTLIFKVPVLTKDLSVYHPPASQEYTFYTLYGLGLLLYLVPLPEIWKLLSAVLLERKIVIMSCNVHYLSGVILAILALVRPFVYQSVVVPILPKKMYEILDAPVPFIVGITEDIPHLSLDSNSNHLDIENGVKNNLVFLDLRTKTGVVSSSSEIILLPDYKGFKNTWDKTVGKNVENGIGGANGSNSSHLLDSMMGNVKEEKAVPYKASEEQVVVLHEVSKIWMEYLAAMFERFESFCLINRSGKEGRITMFLKESFLVDAFPKDKVKRDWLGKFTETLMFGQFCDSKLRQMDEKQTA